MMLGRKKSTSMERGGVLVSVSVQLLSVINVTTFGCELLLFFELVWSLVVPTLCHRQSPFIRLSTNVLGSPNPRGT